MCLTYCLKIALSYSTMLGNIMTKFFPLIVKLWIVETIVKAIRPLFADLVTNIVCNQPPHSNGIFIFHRYLYLTQVH